LKSLDLTAETTLAKTKQATKKVKTFIVMDDFAMSAFVLSLSLGINPLPIDTK
jgi:hypothetical protein